VVCARTSRRTAGDRSRAVARGAGAVGLANEEDA
jgi:hypothetical protein